MHGGTLYDQRCLVRDVVSEVVTCCCLPKVKENLYTKCSPAASCFCWVPYHTLGGEVGGTWDSKLQAKREIQSRARKAFSFRTSFWITLDRTITLCSPPYTHIRTHARAQTLSGNSRARL